MVTDGVRVPDDGKARLVVATYNVHGCVGFDGVEDPERVARVIRSLECDIVGLQEVHSRADPRFVLRQLDHLAALTHMHAIAGPTILRGEDHFGNALLTRHEIQKAVRHDLSYRSREPRGALDVTVLAAQSAIRVVVTHLGLRAAERRYQVKRLLATLGTARSDAPVIVLADFNEWLPFARPLRWLHAASTTSASSRTFPARWPLFALDRIWVRPRASLLSTEVNRTALARQASDHLPVRAEIRWVSGACAAAHAAAAQRSNKRR